MCFSQRMPRLAACETSGGGLLVHPTLGEMTVYVTGRRSAY
ncbi:DNA circularization N-terminal domain-containing protein [Escherichia coli]